MATGGSSSQDDLRVVLLGKIGAGKGSLARRIMGFPFWTHTTERIDLCLRSQRKYDRRKLTVLETPGWDRTSVQRTPEKIKQEIIRSAALCLPGPNALLLVLPISKDDPTLSASEIKSATKHVALLSNRAWRHTIVLFVCRDEMDTSAIDQQVQRAKKLIDKCKGRYFILHNDSDVTALLQKIEDMVEQNRGDFLIPQVSYEELHKEEVYTMEGHLKILLKAAAPEEVFQSLSETWEVHEIHWSQIFRTVTPTMGRSNSYEVLPPNMAETSQGGAAVQDQDSVKETGPENEAL